jgi:hypothetical protein
VPPSRFQIFHLRNKRLRNAFGEGRNRGPSGLVSDGRFPTRSETLMSHIPNSAMPHAKAAEETPERGASGLSGIVEKVRNAPKGVLAAGAVVAAGAVAAAAIPLAKGALADRKGSGGKSKKSA